MRHIQDEGKGVMNYARTLSGAMDIVDRGEGVMNYTRTLLHPGGR